MKNQLTIDIVEPYLDTILEQFKTNKALIREQYDIYALEHNILEKTRLYDDAVANNIVLQPHLNYMVDFKAGYALGNPIKYAKNKEDGIGDLVELNQYIKNADKRSVDSEVATWVYATGIGYYFIEPMSYDMEEDEAPFELYCREADTCVKIYSSYGKKAPLFDILYTTITRVDENEVKRDYDVLSLYLPDMFYEYESEVGPKLGLNVGQNNEFVRMRQQPRTMYRMLPLVEKRLNSDAIGIVAKGVTIQNALDKIMSGNMDNLEELVNEMFVYKNVNLGKTPDEMKEKHVAFKKNGVAVLNSASKELPAELETKSNKIDYSQVLKLFEALKQDLYNTCGVPLASSSVTSGGDTGQARSLGNGWENAFNVLLRDINCFMKSDKDLLKHILYICRNTPGVNIGGLTLKDIDIKYCPNVANNILAKAQSYTDLINTQMPPKMALEKVGLSNDPEEDGKMIDEYIEEQRKLAPDPNTQNMSSLKTIKESNSSKDE